MTSHAKPKLLVAASGTGGHLFPALATADRLADDYDIEWLGVPNRLETELVGYRYPLHTLDIEGFQQRFGTGTLQIFSRLTKAVSPCRKLLRQGNFRGVFTTGGYIAAPAIVAARTLGLPAIVHESNALPGKVTRWLSPWCTCVAIGFEAAETYLRRAKTVYAGTPVRSQFLTPTPLDLPIPEGVPLIAVFGGSQGAVAVNKLVREAAPAWLETGAWLVHLTGNNDPDVGSFSHPQYIEMPFYDNMAGLLQRANLAVTRAGAGTLTELAIAKTPSILIPYPYAAEDHQAFNAAVFGAVGAAIVYRQEDLTAEKLKGKVLELIKSKRDGQLSPLEKMAKQAASLAVPNSGDRLAKLIRETIV